MKFNVLVAQAILALALISMVSATHDSGCGGGGCQFQLDPVYGIRTPIISPGRTVGYGLVKSQDNIYIAGPTSTGTPTGTDFFLLKVSATTGLNVLSFGNGSGFVKTDFGLINGSRTDVATCLDVYGNNIIVGGESVTNTVPIIPPTQNLSFSFAMYNQQTGALVPSFGNGGLRVIKLSPTGLNDEVFGITVVNGFIYAAGFSNPGAVQGAGPSFDGGAVKMDGFGNLVTSWAEGGKTIVDTLGSDERITSIHVDGSGKARLTGRIRPWNVPDFQPLLVNLDANGDYDKNVPADNQFYGPGYSVTNPNGNFITAKSLVDAGMTVLAGEWNGWDKESSGRYSAAMVRFFSSGQLDKKFGDNGIAYLVPSAGTVDVQGICKNSKYLYVVGSSNIAGVIRPFIARFYDQSGNPDITFGVNGFYIQPLVANGFYRDCKIYGGDLHVTGEAVVPPATVATVLHAKYIGIN